MTAALHLARGALLNRSGEDIQKRLTHVADWSHVINRDSARFNGVAICGSYLTVFSRRSRSEIFQSAIAMNTRHILALYSQHRGHISTIATARDVAASSCVHARYDARVHDRRPRRISCSPARIPG